MKWEYWAIHLWQSGANIEHKNADLLNRQGQDEWELVSVDNGIAYIKRPNREYINKIIKDQMGTNPAITPQDESQNSDSYNYETVQDGYVIFDSLGKKVDPWRLVSILNNCLILSGSL